MNGRTEVTDYFTTTVARDFVDLFAGEYLGGGTARHVFTLRTDPTMVVKVETTANSFQNVQEWDVWLRVRETSHAKWFAPCVNISTCGIVLIQRRTMPATEVDYPEKIPSFFTDLKRTNFGRLEDRLVCHDYGLNLLMEEGMTKKLRKAKWWDG